MADGPNVRAGDVPRAENVANIINVNVNNNRNPGGQNNLMNIRDRLFHAIYFKAALFYSLLIPKPVRTALEYLILVKALLFFFTLVYVHMKFIKNPATCLQHVKNWPRDGVLRVEVVPNLDRQRALLAESMEDENLMKALQQHYQDFNGIGPLNKDYQRRLNRYEKKLARMGYHIHRFSVYKNESFVNYLKTEGGKGVAESVSMEVQKLAAESEDDQYIVEYSLEYGYLRLSPAKRKRLHIPVRVVQLDPMTNKCFGDEVSKFILREILGYDDILMASVRVIAEQEDNKGFLRNVITGEHYRFVTMWWVAWGSYPTAFFVMLLFTFSISMLLRFSHNQIFIFIVDLLQMLEFNVATRFPIAPLLTIILALVGMEAIMSEFFNDTTTAFYIILIVWVADQYDAICCHTSITKRHWLRFFFLYHFSFYAYHYRFSGQYRSLALVSSWLFIQHSMFFFFHRYELPIIVQQAQILIGPANVYPAGPGRQRADTLEFRRVNQQQQQPMGQPGQPTAAQPLNNADGTGTGPPDVNAIPRDISFLRRHLHHGHLHHAHQPNLGGPINAMRRALYNTRRGWTLPVLRVHVEVGNLQRINLGTMQINPANVVGDNAATTAAATAEANSNATTTTATTSGISSGIPTEATTVTITTNVGGISESVSQTQNPSIATSSNNTTEIASTNATLQLPTATSTFQTRRASPGEVTFAATPASYQNQLFNSMADGQQLMQPANMEHEIMSEKDNLNDTENMQINQVNVGSELPYIQPVVWPNNEVMETYATNQQLAGKNAAEAGGNLLLDCSNNYVDQLGDNIHIANAAFAMSSQSPIASASNMAFENNRQTSSIINYNKTSIDSEQQHREQLHREQQQIYRPLATAVADPTIASYSTTTTQNVWPQTADTNQQYFYNQQAEKVDNMPFAMTAAEVRTRSSWLCPPSSVKTMPAMSEQFNIIAQNENLIDDNRKEESNVTRTTAAEFLANTTTTNTNSQNPFAAANDNAASSSYRNSNS